MFGFHGKASAPRYRSCSQSRGWTRRGPRAVAAAPTADIPASSVKGPQAAVFAGGCFWGVEAVFRHVKGVDKAVSG